MKRLVFLLFIFTVNISVIAQIKTPQLSTFQKIEQTVGLTNIILEYSRPSIKGRIIFGDLVPFNKIWRTGANANTKITFSKDVFINGKELKAGTYSIYTKPNLKNWDIYFYSETENWGNPKKWEEKKVATSLKVPVVNTSIKTETFTILFGDITNDTATINFLWDTTMVSVPVKFNTDKEVNYNIEKVMGGPSAEDYYTAATYYLNTDKNIEKAKTWIDRAIAMKETPSYNYYRQKSLIYEKEGDLDGAIEAAKTALELAKKNETKEVITLNNELIKNLENKKNK